jgi:pimeloyl-ACP methyl ester carboxylesterase
VIVSDRPGYGESSRLPDRGIAAVADDAAELLDHLDLDAVHVIGQSGGGPHALAFAAKHFDRVRAVSVVVGMVPLKEEDLAGLIKLNRAGWYAAREGWEAMFKLLAPRREERLADPLAGFRATMAAAPASDKAVIEDPAWQRVFVEDTTEALRPGVEGWVDESMALLLPWDFEPGDVKCGGTWWHGARDANVPIAAVQRLASRISGLDLHLWSDAGHLETYHRHDQIFAELLAR